MVTTHLYPPTTTDTMGKAQVKKKTAKRHNPIRVPDSHLGGGRADGKANPEKERQLLPVIEKVCLLCSPSFLRQLSLSSN